MHDGVAERYTVCEEKLAICPVPHNHMHLLRAISFSGSRCHILFWFSGTLCWIRVLPGGDGEKRSRGWLCLVRGSYDYTSETVKLTGLQVLCNSSRIESVISSLSSFGPNLPLFDVPVGKCVRVTAIRFRISK
jgi:hypothetical protein